MLPVEKCIKNGEPGDDDGYTHAHACTHTQKLLGWGDN